MCDDEELRKAEKELDDIQRKYNELADLVDDLGMSGSTDSHNMRKEVLLRLLRIRGLVRGSARNK